MNLHYLYAYTLCYTFYIYCGQVQCTALLVVHKSSTSGVKALCTKSSVW